MASNSSATVICLLGAPDTAEVMFMKIFLRRFVIVLVFFGAFQQLPAATDDHADIKSEITKRHDQAVKRCRIGSVRCRSRRRTVAIQKVLIHGEAGGVMRISAGDVINTDGSPVYLQHWMRAHRKPLGCISCTM